MLEGEILLHQKSLELPPHLTSPLSLIGHVFFFVRTSRLVLHACTHVPLHLLIVWRGRERENMYACVRTRKSTGDICWSATRTVPTQVEERRGTLRDVAVVDALFCPKLEYLSCLLLLGSVFSFRLRRAFSKSAKGRQRSAACGSLRSSFFLSPFLSFFQPLCHSLFCVFLLLSSSGFLSVSASLVFCGRENCIPDVYDILLPLSRVSVRSSEREACHLTGLFQDASETSCPFLSCCCREIPAQPLTLRSASWLPASSNT